MLAFLLQKSALQSITLYSNLSDTRGLIRLLEFLCLALASMPDISILLFVTKYARIIER
jgi:hypothetical protein